MAGLVRQVQEALSIAEHAKAEDRFESGRSGYEKFGELIDKMEQQMRKQKGAMVPYALLWRERKPMLKRARIRAKKEGRKGLWLTPDEQKKFFLKPKLQVRFEREGASDPHRDPWQWFLNLIDREQIDRLHICEFCKKWIFVRVPEGDRAQRFCPGGECLKAWRRSSREYKAAQAAHMQKLRAAEKKRAEQLERSIGYKKSRTRRRK